MTYSTQKSITEIASSISNAANGSPASKFKILNSRTFQPFQPGLVENGQRYSVIHEYEHPAPLTDRMETSGHVLAILSVSGSSSHPTSIAWETRHSDNPGHSGAYQSLARILGVACPI